MSPAARSAAILIWTWSRTSCRNSSRGLAVGEEPCPPRNWLGLRLGLRRPVDCSAAAVVAARVAGLLERRVGLWHRVALFVDLFGGIFSVTDFNRCLHRCLISHRTVI